MEEKPTTQKLKRGLFSSAHMAKIGRRGGNALKRKKGKKHFSKLSSMRKHYRGGRKPKNGTVPANPLTD